MELFMVAAPVGIDAAKRLASLLMVADPANPVALVAVNRLASQSTNYYHSVPTW